MIRPTIVYSIVFIGGVAASLSNECGRYDDGLSGSDSGSNGSADGG